MNSLFYYYRKLLVKSRDWFMLAFLIFLLGVFWGLVFSLTNSDFSTNILHNYSSSLDKNVKEGFDLSRYVFERNFGIVLFSIITGFFFGLVPTVVAFFNGLLLGILLGFRNIYSVLNPLQLFFLLFPHGIFEYLGTFLGLAAALKLGLNWTLAHSRGRRGKVFREDLLGALALLPLVLILLVVAAYIEGNWTAKIACLFSSICH